jgi:hypothetical protein
MGPGGLFATCRSPGCFILDHWIGRKAACCAPQDINKTTEKPMSETISPTVGSMGDKNLRWLWIACGASVALNFVVLAFLLAGRHHPGPYRMSAPGWPGLGFHGGRMPMGAGPHFMRFDGPGGNDRGPGSFRRRSEGRGPENGPRGGSPGSAADWGPDSFRHGPEGRGLEDGPRGGGPGPATDRNLDRLAFRLALTDQQKAQIRPLIDQEHAAIQKDAEDRRQAVERARKDLQAKIKPLLNADQQKKFEDLPLR